MRCEARQAGRQAGSKQQAFNCLYKISNMRSNSSKAAAATCCQRPSGTRQFPEKWSSQVSYRSCVYGGRIELAGRNPATDPISSLQAPGQLWLQLLISNYWAIQQIAAQPMLQGCKNDDYTDKKSKIYTEINYFPIDFR